MSINFILCIDSVFFDVQSKFENHFGRLFGLYYFEMHINFLWGKIDCHEFEVQAARPHVFRGRFTIEKDLILSQRSWGRRNISQVQRGTSYNELVCF